MRPNVGRPFVSFLMSRHPSSVPVRGSLLFATYAGRPTITDDDRVLAAALERHGIVVRAAPWDEAGVAWGEASAVIVRSTWDYHLRREQFLDWTARVASQTALFNTPSIIRWNSHKAYLGELAARGIPVIDTVFAAAGSCTDVAALAIAHGWDDIVIKPSVSASAYETRRFGVTSHAEGQAHLDRLLATGDAMLQPHLASLAERGELAIMFASGRFTHAVRRRSALADDGSMPKSAKARAPAAAVGLAERVLAEAVAITQSPTPPLYARVDLADSARGERLQLLELELIEPSLFFQHAPAAAERLADAVLAAL